jgi:hypothetical protein
MVRQGSVTLSNIKCDCGKVELFSIFPGHEAHRHSIIGLLESEQRTVGWCADCWVRRFGGAVAEEEAV